LSYLPTLRLSFPGDVVQEYRFHENQIEFRNGDGVWRVLNASDLQFHHILHTEVSKWLARESANANRTGAGAK
jgi:hypothetical protein